MTCQDLSLGIHVQQLFDRRYDQEGHQKELKGK